eukprot:4300380-Alexandrium_andersonii.AAC.1
MQEAPKRSVAPSAWGSPRPTLLQRARLQNHASYSCGHQVSDQAHMLLDCQAPEAVEARQRALGPRP